MTTAPPLLTMPSRRMAPLPTLGGDPAPAAPRVPPRRLDPDLQWRRAKTPTLESLDSIRHLVPDADASALLDPPAGITALELEDCRAFPSNMIDPSVGVDSAASLFDELLAPSALHHRTRASYYAAWRSFVSFAYLHSALPQALPASQRLLKAFLWNLLQLGYKPGSITLHMCAILHRHRTFGKPFPVSGSTFKNWTKAFARVLGNPRQDKLAINATILKAILRLPRATLKDLRDAALVALGTVCALRVREICELDVCDALFDRDSSGVLTIRIKVRKNDTGRGGLWPRCGTAANPAYDIPALLRAWLQRAGLHVHPACTKSSHPRSSCTACGRLFSRLAGHGASIFPVGHPWHGATPSTVADALRSSLTRANIDTEGYSGISMRAGGLTTALAADIPKDLFTLQSGHTSDAWKHYVRGHNPMLLRFYEAFEL
jgi:hypothetical protein